MMRMLPISDIDFDKVKNISYKYGDTLNVKGYTLEYVSTGDYDFEVLYILERYTNFVYKVTNQKFKTAFVAIADQYDEVIIEPWEMQTNYKRVPTFNVIGCH